MTTRLPRRLWLFVAAMSLLVAALCWLEWAQSVPHSQAAYNQTNQRADYVAPQNGGYRVIEWAIEKPEVSSSVVIAIFTIVLAISTVLLWVTTLIIGRRQSRDMKRSLEIAERSLTHIERALIVLHSIQCDQLGSPTGIVGYRITTVFTNTGRTPAKQFKSTANFAAFDGQEIPIGFRYSDRMPHSDTLGVIGPGVISTLPINVSIIDLSEIATERRIGIIYGWMEYTDIFSEEVRRTEFCMRIFVVGNLFISPRPISMTSRVTSNLGFGSYGPYNGMDKDCIYEPGETPIAAPGELPPVSELPPGQARLIQFDF